MGLHNEIYQERSKHWVTYKTIKTMNIGQENPKRFYQSLGINLGSTFIVQTDNGIMKRMCVIARSLGYYQETVRDREITWVLSRDCA